MRVHFPFYLISGDNVFVTEDLYLTATQQLTFWTREELNAWIVDHVDKLRSTKIEPPPDYSPMGVLRMWRKMIRERWLLARARRRMRGPSRDFDQGG